MVKLPGLAGFGITATGCMNRIAMTATDSPIARLCKEFRPGCNAIPSGHQDAQKALRKRRTNKQ